MELAKKSLGQHWLNDKATLDAMCEAADLGPQDTILEVGSGKGSLTRELIKRAKKVVTIELDPALAKNLLGNIVSVSKAEPWKAELEVVQGDILKFDLGKLPRGYKVVANIPYYLTSNLLRVLSEAGNPPAMMVLLVQKEVAERIAAAPGQMNILAVGVQLYYQPELGKIVSAELFEPPPKIDSQVIILRRLPATRMILVADEVDSFMRIVKAGFSQRRKKLRGSLSGGLRISKQEADELLKNAGINSEQRAQELSLSQWHKLYSALEKLP